jgi:hypothetical protein
LADTGLPAEYHETLAKLLHAGLVANTTADNFCERQKAYFGCAQCHLCEDDLCNGLVDRAAMREYYVLDFLVK